MRHTDLCGIRKIEREQERVGRGVRRSKAVAGAWRFNADVCTTAIEPVEHCRLPTLGGEGGAAKCVIRKCALELGVGVR